METDIQRMSEDFGVRIVRMYRFLSDRFRDYDVFRQILKSGTSIGANVAEAENAISKKDFVAKMYIALKESAETLYWLRLLYRCGYLSKASFDSMYSDCQSIHRVLTSITKTSTERLNETAKNTVL